MRIRVIAAAVLAPAIALAAPAAASQEPEVLAGPALVEALRAGGHNLYFRHAATDWSQGDQVGGAGGWTSCDGARMRQLSDAGRGAAAEVGTAMRALGIPVGRVLSSPYCRCVETAEQMALGPVETTTDVLNMRAAGYVGGRGAVVETAQARLATAPAPGTNTVIVAHGNVARAATPVYPGEGEGLAFRPDGEGGFDFVGRLAPEEWTRLAREMGGAD